MTVDVESVSSNGSSEVGRWEHILHLDLLVCEATSMIQSSPLNNLLISSKGVAINVGFVSEPARAWPPSLDAVTRVDDGLEGNT